MKIERTSFPQKFPAFLKEYKPKKETPEPGAFQKKLDKEMAKKRHQSTGVKVQ